MGWANIIQGVSQKVEQRGQAMGQYRQEIQNEAIAKQNAALSREEAARVRKQADLAEEAQRRVIVEDLGRAFTAAAQSGARGGGETTIDAMLKQSATLAELDALNIRYGGDLERNAYLTDAANYDLEANLAHKSAGAIKKNLWVPMVGSGLMAAASYGTRGGGGGTSFGAQARANNPYKTVRGVRVPAYVAPKGSGSRRATVVNGGGGTGTKGGGG